MDGEWAGGSIPAQPGWILMWVCSGGGLQGDGVAEGFELPDVVAFTAFGVDAGVVKARAEVGEPGGWVAEQVPDDGQDGTADGDDGASAAAASGDPPSTC